MRQFHKVKYNVGDDVYWNDPDDDLCSGWYVVAEVIDNDVLWLSQKGARHGFQALHSEIRNDTMPKNWSPS